MMLTVEVRYIGGMPFVDGIDDSLTSFGIFLIRLVYLASDALIVERIVKVCNGEIAGLRHIRTVYKPLYL